MDTEIGIITEEPKGKKEKENNSFFEISRKVLLASIGTVALAQDEIEGFIDRLIERGEIAEKDGKKLISEMIEKRKKRSHEARDEVTRKVRESLERMNVPTRADLEKLSSSIAVLSQKIDDLAKSRK